MPRYYVCALPNKKGAGVPKEFISDDLAKIEEWARQHDKPGWGVFDCINPLKDGATARTKDTIAAIESLRIDVDSKDVVETKPEIETQLANMLLHPTVIDSGHGLHADWPLKEQVDTGDAATIARVDAVRDHLIEILCGDRAPGHQAALFRRVGTHNTKNDEWIECKVLRSNGISYDLTELEEMVALYDRPLLTPRLPEKGDEAPHSAFDIGGEAPVDVEPRLAAMQYQGVGDRGIHRTQLQCMAALLRRGTSLTDAANIVYDATRAAMVNDPHAANWDWSKELCAIQILGADFICKNTELADRLPEHLRAAFDDVVAQGRRPKICARHGRLHVRGYLSNRSNNDDTDAPPRADAGKAEAPPRPRRFKLVSFGDMRPGLEPLYLVDELIPIAGLVDVWGKAKCFKSFWTLDLMLHVAMGWEYRDRLVRQGAVVYCAFEGGHGYKKRIEALRRHYAIEEEIVVPLYVMAGQANLVREHATLVRDITEQMAGEVPVAVVLDTLNKSIEGSESKDIDMGNYVRAAEAIRDAFKCVVIVVHHCGLDETRPRGHTSLPGAVDAQLAVMREGDVAIVTVEMMRDGPEDTVVSSRVESVDVGHDQNGKTLTSLVVVPYDGTVVAGSPGAGWTLALKVYREALREALLVHGEIIKEHDDPHAPPARAVNREYVRQEFYGTFQASGETEDQRQESRRKKFGRDGEAAQAKGLIRVRVMSAPDGRTMIWPVNPDATFKRTGP
jgi:AAA domain-containing protein